VLVYWRNNRTAARRVETKQLKRQNAFVDLRFSVWSLWGDQFLRNVSAVWPGSSLQKFSLGPMFLCLIPHSTVLDTPVCFPYADTRPMRLVVALHSMLVIQNAPV
jgi:hypothetical protein